LSVTGSANNKSTILRS